MLATDRKLVSLSAAFDASESKAGSFGLAAPGKRLLPGEMWDGAASLVHAQTKRGMAVSEAPGQPKAACMPQTPQREF